MIRPWAAGLTLFGFAAFSAAYLIATAYLIYRDDLLGGSLARQVAMQYAYEDRIAALRSEIDRVTSRHVVETQGVGEQLAMLLGRQAVIDRHRLDLDKLVGQAEASGIDVAAALARLPRARPAATAAAAAAIVADPALAFGRSPSAGDDVIADMLLSDDGAADSADAAEQQEKIKPILSSVESSLDEADGRQAETLDALTAAAARQSEKLSSALAPIGVPIEAADAEPQGGPFVPAGGLHFVERTALLSRRLDAIAALRAAADALPIRLPVDTADVSSGFGPRIDPFLHRPALHSGLDFAAAAGAEVRAAGPGTVVSAEWFGSYGNTVEIRHADGVTSRYAHLSAFLVEPGTQVSAGTPIGRVGSTGRSTGAHLHYETRKDGKAVDPAPYIAAGRAL